MASRSGAARDAGSGKDHEGLVGMAPRFSTLISFFIGAVATLYFAWQLLASSPESTSENKLTAPMNMISSAKKDEPFSDTNPVEKQSTESPQIETTTKVDCTEILASFYNNLSAIDWRDYHAWQQSRGLWLTQQSSDGSWYQQRPLEAEFDKTTLTTLAEQGDMSAAYWLAQTLMRERDSAATQSEAEVSAMNDAIRFQLEYAAIRGHVPALSTLFFEARRQAHHHSDNNNAALARYYTQTALMYNRLLQWRDGPEQSVTSLPITEQDEKQASLQMQKKLHLWAQRRNEWGLPAFDQSLPPLEQKRRQLITEAGCDE